MLKHWPEIFAGILLCIAATDARAVVTTMPAAPAAVAIDGLDIASDPTTITPGANGSTAIPQSKSANSTTQRTATSRPGAMPVNLPSDTEFGEPAAGPLTALPSDDSPELMLYKDMPIVVAAGKREQTQRQAAAAVTVVTADDIQLFGYRSLADVLRTQRGFYLNTDGLNWFAGVRGFLRPGEWNARILVLVDGRPTREVIYDQTHIDQDFVVPMEAVDRIEIIRGPGSALYGAGAVFSVINIVTKTGAEVNGVQLKVEGGSQKTGRLNALFGFRTKDDWDILGDLSAYASNGDSDIHLDGVNDAAHNYGSIINSDYSGVTSGFLKATKGEFTATFDFEHRIQDNADATYLTSFLNPGNEIESRDNITLKFDHEINTDSHLRAMAYYGDYNYNQDWLVDGSTPQNPEYYHTTAQDKWLGEEVDYDWQISKHVHLLAGAQGTQALIAHQEDSDTTLGTLMNIDNSYNDAGLFTEVEDDLEPWLAITVGGRIDQVQRIGTSISPRFAAVMTPNNSDTVKALYGRAFRAPNLYEQFYSAPGSTPNPALQSEICDTYELVWDHQFADGWRTTLDGYLWKLSDAIADQPLPDGSSQFQNIGTDWAHGLEAEVSKKWASGGSFRVYGSVTRAARDGDGLTHSPQWIAGVSLAMPIINNRTFISIEPQFVAGMKSDLPNPTNPTYVTNIVFTSRDVVKGLDVQVGFYNLFGNYARLPRDNSIDQLASTLHYPYPSVLASLTYRF
jgi:iron complex outermembrane receptor protein